MAKEQMPICPACKHLRPLAGRRWCAKGAAYDTFLFECDEYEYRERE